MCCYSQCAWNRSTLYCFFETDPFAILSSFEITMQFATKSDLKDHPVTAPCSRIFCSCAGSGYYVSRICRLLVSPFVSIIRCLYAILTLIISSPYNLWTRCRGYKRVPDIELGEVGMKNPLSKSAQKKRSEWSFWGIYIDYGLKGKLINLFLLNPIAVVMIVSEFLINMINTYSTTVITKALTAMSQTSSESPSWNKTVQTVSMVTNAPVSYHEATPLVAPPGNVPSTSMTLFYFVLLLVGVIFVIDLSNLIKRLTRPRSTVYKNQIIQRIETKIVGHMQKASHETDKEHGIDDKFEALNRFMWVYDNITDTIIDAAVQTTRSVALCVYIIYQEPVILLVLLIVYSVIWRYVIPYINQKKKKTDSGQKFWERAYYDLSNLGIIRTNPLYDQLYRQDDVELEGVDGIIDIENIAKTEMSHTKNATIIRPNIVNRYMETIRYYSSKHANWDDSYELLQTTQHVIVGLILISMFYTGRFETAIVILINRHALFSMINTFSNLKRSEKNAERSMEPIQKILEAVDKQIEEHSADNIKTPVQLIGVQKADERLRISSIQIDKMKILIPAQKALKKESEKKENETEDDESKDIAAKPVGYDRYVCLETGRIDYEVGKTLLLEGITGCGKSVTINAIAGLYTRNICNAMTISFSNGSHVDAEFNQILGSRCYVSQMLSDEFKINGKITLPMFKLFPGARDIEEITTFLVDVFALQPASIPESLADHPHSKLSGGELQRYVVATQIWRAIRIKPDMLILDEVDRALDKETAVKVMSWIVSNVKCFFVIVTHLTEVKQMLMDRRCVSQVWTYETSESDKQQIKIVTHRP